MNALRQKKGPRIVRIHVSNFFFKHNMLKKIDVLKVPIVCKKQRQFYKAQKISNIVEVVKKPKGQKTRFPRFFGFGLKAYA